MFPIFAGNSASTGYNLTRSLRFRASASAYLNRTPASATNRRTFTLSTWVKRGALTSYQNFMRAGGTLLRFTNTDTITYDDGLGSSNPTTAVFRDPSAWYHVVLAVDTTQATSTNRVKIYVNSTLQTITGTYPTLNSDSSFNNNVAHFIGQNTAGAEYLDGYLAEFNFVDGQALTPSSFGSTNATTGVWQPARYTGTYGTNGFYLPFTDNSALTTSSNVGLGKDFSGNGNYWTTNNISLTSGVTYDSMTDVPTLTSATAANFCVLNPINKSPSSTVSNGNLRQTSSGGWYRAYSTIFFASTAAFYAEATMTLLNSSSNGVRVGIANANSVFTYVGSDANSWSYDNQGSKLNNAVTVAYGSSYVQGDVIGILFNNGSLTFYKNNVSQGVAYSGLTGTFCFSGSPFDTDTVDWNFGQRPFAYSLPSGALALNTFNLPTSTIVKGNTVMDATLYTGTGASLSVTNTASFKPDLVWVKGRSGATDHAWYDSVRGVQKQLESNTTTAETTETTGLTAFGSAGFTVGALAQMNTSAATYVGWQWQAGQGTNTTNTNGTITSTVSVNASAGLSMVTYTGTGANATVGHGLGVAPSMIITKNRGATSDWGVYHSSLTSAAYFLLLSTTAAQASGATYWNSTAPTSSVFSVGTATPTNASANTYVAYCWTPIAGYSAFGSYTGNGSADGPFVYTNFQPKFVLIKASSTTSQWVLWDTARNTYNVTNSILYPNLSAAEASFSIDILSNGFKFREVGGAGNDSGVTYIYAAFATSPFKNSLAR